MTPEQWDTHYWRIRLDLVKDGTCVADAAAIAEQDTTAQFGPRPHETEAS